MARKAAVVSRQAEPAIVENDYDAMSVEELDAIIERAGAARQAKIAGERKTFVEETRKRAAALGLNLSFDETSPTKRTRPTAAPKYRDGEATWTGRGRKPNWVIAIEAEGKSIEDYAV